MPEKADQRSSPRVVGGALRWGGGLHDETEETARIEDEKEKGMTRIKEEIGVFARWKEKQKQKGLSCGVAEWGDYKNSQQFTTDWHDHGDRITDKQDAGAAVLDCSVCERWCFNKTCNHRSCCCMCGASIDQIREKSQNVRDKYPVM